MTIYTVFNDMYSGGYKKLEHSTYLVLGEEDEAVKLFEQNTGRDPDYVTCNCCGPDYSYMELDSEDEGWGAEELKRLLNEQKERNIKVILS